MRSLRRRVDAATKQNRQPKISIAGGSFIVVTSGFADGPAQPLVRFLNDHGASRVTAVAHPLVGEGPAEHRIDEYVDGIAASSRARRLPNRPPFTYVLDPFVPLHLPRADMWIGFNCLASSQGLIRRRFGLVRSVVHWNVDFVPERFGKNPLTAAYEWLDRQCCLRSDGRVELSAEARDGRMTAYSMNAATCPVEIIPMGSWNTETPKTSSEMLQQPRLVFLGHLVERMGLPLLIDVVELLRNRGSWVHTDIIGSGPELARLQADASKRGLIDDITWHGFVKDFREVERILAHGAIALAPYETTESSFSRFADPGKLKAYLGAGLPILLTDVPPNAAELAVHAGAAVLEPDPTAFADAIEHLLADRAEWQRRHMASLEHAHAYDWETMFTNSLPRLGVVV